MDLSLGRRFIVHHSCAVDIAPSDLQSAPQCVADLDYATIASPDLDMPFCFTVERPGPADGFALWFETELADGIGYSSGTSAGPSVYRTVFHPFAEAVDLAAGDVVEGTIFAQLVDGRYRWSWRTRVTKGGETVADFRQSSDFESLYARGAFTPFGADHVPEPGPAIAIQRTCLALFDGHNDLGAIARRLAGDFPGDFADEASALDYAARFAQDYARLSGGTR